MQRQFNLKQLVKTLMIGMNINMPLPNSKGKGPIATDRRVNRVLQPHRVWGTAHERRAQTSTSVSFPYVIQGHL